MNFLQLCVELHTKVGESGTGPSTVLNQSGVYARLVGQIKNAWVDIQSTHASWSFLRKIAQPTVAASQDIVDVDTWVTSNLTTSIDVLHEDTFSIYKTALGISDESRLIYIPWTEWKDRFGIQYADGVPNRPQYVTWKPDRTLLLGPVTDDAYTLHFEFSEEPVVLAEDTDIPNINANLHMIIVYKALERYGNREQSKWDVAEGRREYFRFLSRMQRRYLPKIKLGGTLA